ncbi:MAG: hypothetical protein J6F30_14045 [Cellulosilyticum sp.]|nr:hypothetical protein [Cellulosilyticum sp.]
MRLPFREKFSFLTDRLFYMMLVITIMFAIVIYHFYGIQILEHETYLAMVISNVQREVEIPAPRGIIYDRYGKPLVMNQSINVLQFDPDIKLGKEVNTNEILLKVVNLLEKEDQEYIDNIPISKRPPFIYTTEDENSIHQFITNYVPYNDNEDKLELYKLSAKKLIEYLCSPKIYNIGDEFSEVEKRKILAMRIQISQTQYQKYKKVTIAEDVSMKVVAAIEENQEEYPAITAEVSSRRYYPYGKPLGNIMGYMRKITFSQYEALKEEGYDADDIIGQVGIEGEFESILRGVNGNQLIEVDNVGRTVVVDNQEYQEAVPGNDVFLTIDVDLQVKVYEALEKRLSQGIIERLKGAAKTTPLTGREVIVSMAKNSQIDLREMSEENSKVQKQLYEKIEKSYNQEIKRLEQLESNLPEKNRTNLNMKMHFAHLLEEEESCITDQELLITFGEQGTVEWTEDEWHQIQSGNYQLLNLLITALETGRILPEQMDITPCSGTAVVVDSNNGETLALVSYPSYDSNEFTGDFNTIYRKLHDGVDNRSIEFNRALKTVKAPGSTFKMITGIAGLEEEVVGASEMIYDSGQFTKAAGEPLKCWIFANTGHGHGNEDMIGALEVSCNYYFNEVVYRLGEKYGAPYGGIKVLSNYAKIFGLGEKSGIELEEAAPNVSNPTNAVYTQIARTLNRLKNMTEDGVEDLYHELEYYCEEMNGFYTLGSSEDSTLEGQIDYLSRPYIKSRIDAELSLVLRENQNLQMILKRLIEADQECFAEGISQYADQLTKTVMNGDETLSLKYRTKKALNPLLKQLADDKTKKAIRKMLASMPEGTLEQIFLEGYAETLKKYQGQSDKEAVCNALKEAITALEQGTLDCKEVMTNKILDRIINVYLDQQFESVEMEWSTRDNLSSSIGQGEHAYTPVQIARYMAGLANGHTLYDLTILSGVYDHKEKETYIQHEPTIHNQLNLKEETIQVIHEGMRAVATGNHGTARDYFKDFEIEIAAKTGTAQENGYENTWITTFAPYDSPELVVVSSMYGTDGLGGCTYDFVKDIYSLYFKLNSQTEKFTLDNKMIE